MKKTFISAGILFLVIVLLASNGCTPSSPGPQFPGYSSNDEIINPPDVFQVIYDISYNGNRLANITFENDAVWRIEKLGDIRIYFWAQNDSGALVIEDVDTLALKAGYNYIFGANNNNINEFNSLFTQFNKLELDYDSFNPKF